MKIETACYFNHIYVIQSLNRKGDNTDLPTAQNLFDSTIKPLGMNEKLGVDFFDIKSKNELIEKLDIIRIEATLGHIPFIHIDMHGDKNKGLKISPSGEYITWLELKFKCQQINEACANNLALILASCFGFHAILSLRITEVNPFFLLIGSQVRVPGGFIDDNFPQFYNSIFTDGNIDKGLKYLSKYYKLYLSEKILVNSYAQYIMESCKGKRKQKRVEQLLTKYNQLNPDLNFDITTARKKLKNQIKPNEESFKRFQENFLLANHPKNKGRFGANFEFVLREIDRIIDNKK